MKNTLLFSLVLSFLFSFSQDGSPDLSFGENGVATYEFGVNLNINDVVESNGKYFIYLNMPNENGSYVNKIFSLNQDGTINTSFGENGIADASFLGPSFVKLKKLSDGGFLVLGGDYVYTAVRFDSSGQYDPNFGTNGEVNPFASGGGSVLTVNEHQAIYFVNRVLQSGQPKLRISKYDESGNLDAFFGTEGVFIHDIGNIGNQFVNFKFYSNHLYLGVQEIVNDNVLRCVYRFNLNGEIDTTYGNNGKVILPFESNFHFRNYDIFNDGSILYLKSLYDFETGEILKLIKVNNQGQIVEGFGNMGVIEGLELAFIQNDQKIILDTSTQIQDEGVALNLNRYSIDGAIDESFQFSSNHININVNYKLNYLQNGKILITGLDHDVDTFSYIFSIQRFNNTLLNTTEFSTKKVAFYPNPSTGIFNYSSKLNLLNESFMIYDSSGRVIKSGSFNQDIAPVDLTAFPHGVYFLNIPNLNYTFKLLKN